MGRLQTWGDAARHSRVLQVVAGVVVIALVAGGVVVATRSGPPAPTHAPKVLTRAVALGDSVPYGHGLANPYRTSQIGLPAHAVSQGPSPEAYPSLVANDLGLTMTVRSTNCDLVGDQLSISGATADGADNTARDGQCLVPPQQARNLADELAASDLVQHPARLVLLQDGADDIDFSACLEFQLARVLGVGIGLGHSCVTNGSVTPQIAAELANVRTSLAQAIETLAPHATDVAVLNYYQPIPEPSQIAKGTATSGLHTNLVCAGLKPNAGSTYTAAQVVLSALNGAVAGAVGDARTHHVKNVTLVDVSGALDGHGICTAQPWVFSGEPVPDTTLAADAEHIVAAKACSGTDVLHGEARCASLTASALAAERSLQDYVWRAAHPTAAGQRAIAALVEHQLGRRR
jgi:lysophospholipase L1-like esterase